jgi:hypothetical protein
VFLLCITLLAAFDCALHPVQPQPQHLASSPFPPLKRPRPFAHLGSRTPSPAGCQPPHSRSGPQQGCSHSCRPTSPRRPSKPASACRGTDVVGVVDEADNGQEGERRGVERRARPAVVTRRRRSRKPQRPAPKPNSPWGPFRTRPLSLHHNNQLPHA